MSSELVSILIPTWDNPQFLHPALTSLINNAATENLFHVYVVNNGHPDSCNWIDSPLITVLQTGGDNLGWEGGLKLGLEHSKAPFVCFFNDDAYIPSLSRLWINQLLQHFKNPKVGAVGPSSNVVMGMQSIFADIRYSSYLARFLIGFCMMVRRSALDEVGGVDDTLPGGDDLDLSIRLRDAGYKLVADREVFVFHHGFKSGERLHGTSDKVFGWNSYEFTEKVDLALIKKHGFKKWWECKKGTYLFDDDNLDLVQFTISDFEGDLVRARVKGEKILDLGCGANKTLPEAIGVDMIKRDEFIESLGHEAISQSDVVADVSKPLPFEPDSVDTIISRHILEHLLDPIQSIRQWISCLKVGGRLIIAVPNQDRGNSIPMNTEHIHAWNPQSMMTLLTTCGLKVIEQLDGGNNVSFITVGVKT